MSAVLQRAGDALVLEGVTRAFGALKAIENVSFSVAAGERRAVIGANGAGKTTLFNVITGDFPATAGRVLFFGDDVTLQPPFERIRAGLRRTYQSSLLFRELSVRDNLYLAVRGVTRRRFSFFRERSNLQAESLLDRVRLRAVADQPVSALSHGQQRQLEVGMALAGAPRLVLFDEPAAGLSPAERTELVALLTALPRHIGFILIEHDLDIALRVVDRVTVMHNGRLLKEGSPAEIENDPEVQAIYMGGKTLMLEISNLDVHYGRAHALQSVSLKFERGVLAVVGRNGMGKTTLCNAVTGLLRGIGGTTAGSIKLDGEEILGLAPNVITGKGIGYVPQGRRVWPSLSVDEHLQMVKTKGPWTVERVYATFPRLAERKRNGGAELSGGEQQMLAISRALLFNPKLLVMDEPTEGLAPVIVQQVAAMLKTLAGEGQISVLLIEQNLGVAIDVADTIDVMVNGRIARSMPSAELAADRDLQQRLLGVKMDADAEEALPAAQPESNQVQVLTVRRATDTVVVEEPQERSVRGFTRWGSTNQDRAVNVEEQKAPEPRVVEFPVAHSTERAAYIVGTFDTKGRELFYLRNCLDKLGLRTVTVDLATSGKPSPAQIHPREVARHHPKGERVVFTGDRGSAVTGMAEALEAFLVRRRDLGGIISAGGSGGTALATQGMRRLPIGVPKVMVSTVASGDVKPYVGPSDISMMYSVTDISGINRISEKVLANAAHSLAGMLAFGSTGKTTSESKPALGLTMFGLTTPCVQAVTKQLDERYDCLVFHATGTGGQAMEKLAESGLLSGVIDVTTTEVTDEIVGGVLTAGATRMDVFSKLKIPYVGSLGAVDMVNFWAYETVPSQFKDRTLYRHNSNVTLMRTTAEEAAKIGRFIVDKLNRIDAPLRFLIPEGGLSGLDKPGGAFWDPAANKALFDAITANFRSGGNKKLLKLPHHVNDQAFADALVANYNEIAAPWQELRAQKS